MFDFGRSLLREGGDARVPVMLALAPRSDYAGVFVLLGFETAFLRLCPGDGFRPRVDDLLEFAYTLESNAARRLALVVVNAQQNPTGVDWGDASVAKLVEVAAAGTALHFDNAHCALLEPGRRPTAAVRVVCWPLRGG